MTEPIAIMVKRYKCPHCNRSRSAKKATLEHMGRCWQNPDARGCRTCANYEPASGGGPDHGLYEWDPPADEHCRAGVDLTVRPCPTCEGSSAAANGFVDCGECGNTGVDKATSQPIVHCEKWEPAHA